jgi:glycosyltransferase involved in cell wall biosynthesis
VERTLVFVPAWNEERNLRPVLAELRRELPDADVLVVDDGSTDATADVARRGGADVLSFEENRGLRAAIAAGYGAAAERGYAYCGRVDADGQHPVRELRRLLERVREDECDVAVGSRFVGGDGYAAYRYRPSADRALGIAVLRRLMELRLDRPFGDATSGMYAVNAKAAKLLAEPYVSDAPEVEGLIRLEEAGLRVREVPVDMRERQGGASKLSGKKALKVVTTVGVTILLGRRVLRLLRR